MGDSRPRFCTDPTPLPGFEPVWLGQFDTFSDWVECATGSLAYFTGSMGEKISAICVDSLGRRCHIGADFHRARDEGTFPVRYFLEGQVVEPTSLPAGQEPQSGAVVSDISLWRVTISVPRLDTDYLIASVGPPTHEQIEAVWRADHPVWNPARPLRPLGWRGPLAQAYPGVGGIERVDVWVPPAPAASGDKA